jgi:HEAT repeat protein
MELVEVLKMIRDEESVATSWPDLRERLDCRAQVLKRDLAVGCLESTFAGLQVGHRADRVFAALLLREADVGESIIGELLSPLLDVEADAEVVAEIVTTLGFTRDPLLLTKMLALVVHESPIVRFQVATSLPQMGGCRQDVIDALVGLLGDVDDDVRWSAAFELSVCWNEAGGDALGEMLLFVSQHDPSKEVRDVIRLTMVR